MKRLRCANHVDAIGKMDEPEPGKASELDREFANEANVEAREDKEVPRTSGLPQPPAVCKTASADPDEMGNAEKERQAQEPQSVTGVAEEVKGIVELAGGEYPAFNAGSEASPEFGSGMLEEGHEDHKADRLEEGNEDG